MTQILVRFTILSLVLFSSHVFAGSCEQSYNSVGFLGVDSSNGTIYVAVSGHNNKCNMSSFRFQEVNADTDKILSILMTAKISEKKVRIDLKDSTDPNSAYRVYMH